MEGVEYICLAQLPVERWESVPNVYAERTRLRT